MHHRLAIAFVLSLIAVSAVAADFDVSYEVIENRILPGDTAYFTITIANRLDSEDRFRLHIEDVHWILPSDPDTY